MQKKIVFVGAPTSGKTSVLEGLKNRVNKELKIPVDFVPEIATEFLKNLPPDLHKRDDCLLRQIRLYRTQLLLEQHICDIRKETDASSVMLCDRGIADLYVYLNSWEIIKGFDENELAGVYNNYDHVFFFLPAQTADIQNFLSSNDARREKNSHEILELSDKSLMVWSRHKSFKTISHQPTLEDKICLVASLINQALDVPLFLTDPSGQTSSRLHKHP